MHALTQNVQCLNRLLCPATAWRCNHQPPPPSPRKGTMTTVESSASKPARRWRLVEHLAGYHSNGCAGLSQYELHIEYPQLHAANLFEAPAKLGMVVAQHAWRPLSECRKTPGSHNSSMPPVHPKYHLKHPAAIQHALSCQLDIHLSTGLWLALQTATSPTRSGEPGSNARWSLRSGGGSIRDVGSRLFRGCLASSVCMLIR